MTINYSKMFLSPLPLSGNMLKRNSQKWADFYLVLTSKILNFANISSITHSNFTFCVSSGLFPFSYNRLKVLDYPRGHSKFADKSGVVKCQFKEPLGWVPLNQLIFESLMRKNANYSFGHRIG